METELNSKCNIGTNDANDVYIVESFGGSYEDKWESIIGVYSTYDKAMASAKSEVDTYCVKDSDLPMTWEEYERCNYGNPDAPEDGYDFNDISLCEYYNSIIDRDGYTKEQFKMMDDAMTMRQQDFSYCKRTLFRIDDDTCKQKVVRISEGLEDDEKYHIW